MARHTLTAVHRGTFDQIDPSEWTGDSFADLTHPDVLAALGFVRSRSGGRTIYRTDEDDTSLVVEVPAPPTSTTYRRAVITVNLVAGWHPVVSCSFVWTNSPVQGPAYRSQTKATRNTQQKAVTQ
jgi:hypothetical protein